MKMAQERWSAEQKDAEHALETRKLEVENLVKPLREEMEKWSNSTTPWKKNVRAPTRE